jgi:inorganic pyrophosphatase
VPHTLAEDGDPLDVLVMTEDPTFPGCHVRARVLGVFWMEDEQGPDAKILTVPDPDSRWDGIDDIADLPPFLLQEIEHFFEIYKTLEPGKTTKTGGWEGRERALEVIEDSRRRYTD